MKHLIYLLLFSFILIGCASNKEATNEQMKHLYLKEYPGLTKDVIFDRTMKWIAQNFKSAKSVIDYQDKSAGSIIAKGVIPNVDFGNVLNSDLSFTLTTDIKDGKARFDFTNIMPLDPSNGKEVTSISETERVHIASKREFGKLIDQISTAILTKDDF